MDSTLFEHLQDVHKELTEMRVILARQAENLEEHMRRTDLLEKKTELLHEKYIGLKGFISYMGWIVAMLSVAVPMIQHWLK